MTTDHHRTAEVRVTLGPPWFLIGCLAILAGLGVMGWVLLTAAP